MPFLSPMIAKVEPTMRTVMAEFSDARDHPVLETLHALVGYPIARPRDRDQPWWQDRA
jgi:hypothetical protein